MLDEEAAGGPPEAFKAGREFALLHPDHDGSLHMSLPADISRSTYDQGWGEPHPLSGTPLIFAPRDEDELEVVLCLLWASYEYAVGPGARYTLTVTQGALTFSAVTSRRARSDRGRAYGRPRHPQ